MKKNELVIFETADNAIMLDENTSVEIFDRSQNASRPPKFYNLDVIISVGYLVK